MLILLGLLIFALARGCKKNNSAIQDYNKVKSANDSLISLVNANDVQRDSSKKLFQDSLEFERGQYALLELQKERIEGEMSILSRDNERLIQKHKDERYTDTTATIVPREYLTDCEGCFSNLEKTNSLNNKYQNQMNQIQKSWVEQSSLLNNRIKDLEKSNSIFSDNIRSMANNQKEALDKLKPRGRLYLSWGVLWQGWPSAAGAGLMYQTPRNMIFGVIGYYGAGKTTIGTTINFPLSLRK